MIGRQAIRQRWAADGSKRDERGRRLFAASEVRAAGWGGLAAVSKITGLARSTIERGLKDLDAPPLASVRVSSGDAMITNEGELADSLCRHLREAVTALRKAKLKRLGALLCHGLFPTARLKSED